MTTSRETPTVVQLRPKRNVSGKTGAVTAPPAIRPDLHLGFLKAIDLALSKLSTLLACAKHNVENLEGLNPDGSLKERLALLKVGQLSDLVTMSVDMCDRAKDAYELYSEIATDILSNPGAKR